MAIQGVSIAFADAWDEVSPTWTQIDTGTTDYVVQSWTIDRGRPSEIDKTVTGTATINLVDWSGDFDPSWAGSAFYGNLDPMKQVAIALEDPTNSTWATLFRGFVSKWTWSVDPTEKFLYVTIDCVDGVDMECADRINAILDDAGWPSGLRSVFTGNVAVTPAIYAPRSQFLSAIDDSADAEFPGVANRYISKDGIFTFHGRLARFNPADVQYDITTWKVGDDAAVASDSSRAPIMPPLEFVRDVEDVVNAVYAAPQGIADADISGQWADDATSITKYGYRSLSFENLLTEHGYLLDSDDLVETLSFAPYYVDNKATPRTRVPQVTFKGVDKDDPRASNVWDLICNIDISDIIDISTSHAWGGGFAEDYYVEGVHYECSPGSDRQHDVTLTVDISPKAYYDTNEWS